MRLTSIIFFAVAITISLLPGISLAQMSNNSGPLESSIAEIAKSSVLLSVAEDKLITADAIAKLAAKEVSDAEAEIVRANNWLSQYNDSSNVGDDRKQEHRDIIVAQTAIMLAAKERWAEAAVEVTKAQSLTNAASNRYDTARESLIGLVTTSVADEQAHTDAALEQRVSRVLTGKLLNVCNDKLAEADAETCDDFEGEISIISTLAKMRGLVGPSHSNQGVNTDKRIADALGN